MKAVHPGDRIALTVDGGSMDMVAPHGATILVNRADSALVAGRLYVFTQGSGEATFKQWQSDPDRLHPYPTTGRLPRYRFTIATICMLSAGSGV